MCKSKFMQFSYKVLYFIPFGKLNILNKNQIYYVYVLYISKGYTKNKTLKRI